jgi:hypothetical protein
MIVVSDPKRFPTSRISTDTAELDNALDSIIESNTTAAASRLNAIQTGGGGGRGRQACRREKR